LKVTAAVAPGMTDEPPAGDGESTPDDVGAPGDASTPPADADGSSAGRYIGDVDAAALTDAGPDALSLTPEQHERLKRHLHGEQFEAIKRADRRYLVVGRGDGEAGERRERIRDLLDDRRGAAAFRMEAFGLTDDEIELWAPAFDILAATATHVVGVLEDYDGGHVWELGHLYHEQRRVRDVLWLLKRTYDSDRRRRERYDNGMAASHLAALEAAAGERVIRWTDPAELPAAVERIP
jgi:hypothetical protein